jgi:hypothetical protein
LVRAAPDCVEFPYVTHYNRRHRQPKTTQSKQNMRVRLSLLMFLQLFIWGGWFVSMGTYLVMSLGAGGVETGLAYATRAWGAIAAPLFVGLGADRFGSWTALRRALRHAPGGEEVSS